MRDQRWLIAKELRELLASPAYWLFLVSVGALTGHAAITAVNSYREMTGTGGPTAALPQALSPLDGFVIPMFGSLSLAATLLLPFVVIRLVGQDLRSGAWKILLQARPGLARQLGAKLLVLSIAWIAAWIPVGIAMLSWTGTGNHLDPREAAGTALGHFLFGALTIALAAAAAALARADAVAAIVTLGVTLGTWAIDFAGAVQGGGFAVAARFTPTAMLSQFEHGLVRLDAILLFLIATAALGAVAATSLDWRLPVRARRARFTAIGLGVLLLGAFASRARSSWDWTEDRRHSFPPADEAELGHLAQPLRIEAHLAPEDPRRQDFERTVRVKLERALPRVEVSYRSATKSGLFEQAGTGYGEIWYQLGERRSMSRSTTAPIVLETIYALAGLTAPTAANAQYPGYPMVRAPAVLGWLLFAGWPLGVALVWILARRNRLRFRSRASNEAIA